MRKCRSCRRLLSNGFPILDLKYFFMKPSMLRSLSGSSMRLAFFISRNAFIVFGRVSRSQNSVVPLLFIIRSIKKNFSSMARALMCISDMPSTACTAMVFPLSSEVEICFDCIINVYFSSFALYSYSTSVRSEIVACHTANARKLCVRCFPPFQSKILPLAY